MADQAFCALVSDGAGSAKFGGEGAWQTCGALTYMLRHHFREEAALPSDAILWETIDQIRDTLSLAAERREATRRDFACTLVMLVILGDEMLIAHVGDGAIVGRETAGVWRSLSWPENGQYASTTYFLTDDPAPKLRLTRLPAEFDAIAVFSDGLEDLALDFNSKVPHEPFFRTMLAPLDNLRTSGKDTLLSNALLGFLGSERVCDRTDDDKSIILASQR